MTEAGTACNAEMTCAAANLREAERLNALRRYNILDTATEAAYDDLTHLAATLCSTPVAAVALVDAHRIWFKSVAGLEARSLRRGNQPPQRDLGRLVDTVMVMEDTRLHGWPASPEPGQPENGDVRPGRRPAWSDSIRFFASAPLISRDGFALGSLCVMDYCPRTLSDSQQDTLKTLARQVTAHLELRRNARDLADTVAELREAEKTIRFMAFHDALTGLPGRLLFQDRLSHALKRARRRDEFVAVMFLDLDGFKAVNDTWGHATGDRLLVSVAARLTGALRKADTVARIGGDEFAIICPDLHDERDAAIVAEKLLQTFDNPQPAEGRGLVITASIGIALYPRDATTPEALLIDADTAMYRAKRQGKNTYAFCTVANAKSCQLDTAAARIAGEADGELESV